MQIKYLIIRFSSIGDIVLTSPVIRGLKQQVEGTEVHFLTKASYRNILDNNPYVDKVHVLKNSLRETVNELREEGFDYVIDLHHNLRTQRLKNRLKVVDFSVNKLNREKWLMVNFKKNKLPDKHIVDRYLETVSVFDVINDMQGLDYFIPEEDSTEKLRSEHNLSQSYIAFAIGGQHATKKLDETSLDALCANVNSPLVLLGGKEDVEQAEKLSNSHAHVMNFCGKLNLNQSADMVKHAKLVITHDTGLMHIAAAFHKPILSIWGNTIPEFGMTPYLPNENSKIFEVKDLKCRPCSKIGFDKCPKKHFDCMKSKTLMQLHNMQINSVK